MIKYFFFFKKEEEEKQEAWNITTCNESEILPIAFLFRFLLIVVGVGKSAGEEEGAGLITKEGGGVEEERVGWDIYIIVVVSSDVWTRAMFLDGDGHGTDITKPTTLEFQMAYPSRPTLLLLVGPGLRPMRFGLHDIGRILFYLRRWRIAAAVGALRPLHVQSSLLFPTASSPYEVLLLLRSLTFFEIDSIGRWGFLDVWEMSGFDFGGKALFCNC